MSDEVRWSLPTRIGFRFAFAYLVLYSFPFPLEYVPGAGLLLEPFDELWTALALWVGRSLLGITREIPLGPSGSGDTTIDYLHNLCVLAVAVAAAIVWSVLDRRRRDYSRLHDGLRVYLRYSLGIALVSYGFAKVLGTQFPSPPPARFVQPLGQFSPMGLLWTFMGYSASYECFTGAMEVLAGVLLFLRRTTTLGALVGFGVMANVVVLNFTFDVPVKLYSLHLLLTAAFLAAPDMQRVLNVFVLNRAVPPVELWPRPASARRRRALLAVKAVFVGYALFMIVESGLQFRSEMRTTHPWLGLYEVVEFTRNGEVEPLALDRTGRWRWVSLGSYDVRVNLMDDGALRYLVEYDHEHGSLELEDFFERGDKYQLEVLPSGENLILEGTLKADRITARLNKMDMSRFLLASRGFHWINEVPYNR